MCFVYTKVAIWRIKVLWNKNNLMECMWCYTFQKFKKRTFMLIQVFILVLVVIKASLDSILKTSSMNLFTVNCKNTRIIWLLRNNTFLVIYLIMLNKFHPLFQCPDWSYCFENNRFNFLRKFSRNEICPLEGTKAEAPFFFSVFLNKNLWLVKI